MRLEALGICRDDACEVDGLHRRGRMCKRSENHAPRAHHRPLAKPVWQQPDPDGVLESIKKAVPEIRPVWFQQVSSDVRNDFGDVGDRTIWRGLKKLVERGELLRLDLGLAFHAYIKPVRRGERVPCRLDPDEMREYMLSIVEIHPSMKDA